MHNIRVKVTIHLNHNHALAADDLRALRPLIERGIAASLPDALAVDTIRVTKIRENSADLPEREGPRGARAK